MQKKQSLLVTQLQVPPPPHYALPRPRLNKRLESRLADTNLALITTPAGYGKTTFLASWARESEFMVAWLTVSEDDNVPLTFMRGLTAAWERVDPRVSRSSLALIVDSAAPDLSTATAAFIELAGSAQQQIAFVLDDYQLIESEAIHELVTVLVDNLPPQAHLVLASRGAPELPLARFRAHDRLLELQAHDLAFSAEETQRYLSRRLDLDYDQEDAEALNGQLEGWAAGLQMVAKTLDTELTEREAPQVSGRQRFIADFLAEDVFGRQPPTVRDFLLRTSILDQLCAPLCTAVTGNADSQEMLEFLEGEDLFLQPLDDHREWYRYQRLFADFLRGELWRSGEIDTAEMHRRAARWYLENDLPDAAFRHALEGQSSDLGSQVMERYLLVRLLTGEQTAARSWMEAIPPDWYDADPKLVLVRAFFWAGTGSFEASQRSLDQLEARAHKETTVDEGRVLPLVTGCRSLIACIQNDLPNGEYYAKKALADLGAQENFFRASIHHGLGDLYRQNALWEKAETSYRQALRFAVEPASSFRHAHIYGSLADLDLRRGLQREAMARWREAEAALNDPNSRGRIPLPVMGWIHIRMGEIQYEWDQRERAWEQLDTGMERAELGGDERSLIAGWLLAARLHLSAGANAEAEKALDGARTYLERVQFPDWNGRFQRARLELWLASGRLRAAVIWSDEQLAALDLDEQPYGDETRLAVARVLIFKGDRPAVERALSLLRVVREAAEADGRNGMLIEALALVALAHTAQGDQTAALAALERALRLAEPQGYVRTFVDLGLPMGRLLQDAYGRGVFRDYVERLLDAFGEAVDDEEPAALPEPLTTREREVLRLMTAGLTNREIGEELFISPGTVKKHAANIYGKLGVGGRMEAALRGRELNLLD